MKNWIERYIYDVTRRLPETEREDVAKELNANILDMLPEDPSEEEVKTVLKGLGIPAELAEKYRAKPRYLISPAQYEDYIRLLKWVVPLVAVVVFLVMTALSIAEGLSGDLTAVIATALSAGLGGAVEGTLQALLWVTLSFVIIDRVGGCKPESDWSPEDLPELLPNNKGRIPLSDCVAELVILGIGTCFVVALLSGVFPLAFSISMEGVEVRRIFAPEFTVLLPYAAAILLLPSLVANILKLIAQRWTPAVCGAVIADNLISTGVTIFLLTRPVIFSAELMDLAAQTSLWTEYLSRWKDQGLILSIVVVVLLGLIEPATALWKTVKYYRVGA